MGISIFHRDFCLFLVVVGGGGFANGSKPPKSPKPYKTDRELIFHDLQVEGISSMAHTLGFEVQLDNGRCLRFDGGRVSGFRGLARVSG